MPVADKRLMAQRLRVEAQGIRHHGQTNFFQHVFPCLRSCSASKSPKGAQCDTCPLRPFLQADYRQEAFPCHEVAQRGWALAAEHKELAEDYVKWLLRTAERLEAEAERAYPVDWST
ncbi:MAG: hypothetical protein ACE5HB_03165 [Terriglobia bacterium]